MEHIRDTFTLTKEEVNNKRVILSSPAIPESIIFRTNTIPYNYSPTMRIDFTILKGSDNSFRILTWNSKLVSSSSLRKSDQKIENFLEEGSVIQINYVKDIRSVGDDTDLSELPLSSSISLIGTNNRRDWYRTEVIAKVSATRVADQIFINPDDAGFIEKSIYTFTEDGQHDIKYYSVSSDGRVEDVNSKTFYIDTTPVIIQNIALDKNDWIIGDGPVTYTIDVGEDTSGWEGTIDLSDFGKEESFLLDTTGNVLFAKFTPLNLDATSSPKVTVRDKAGNLDTAISPELRTFYTEPESEEEDDDSDGIPANELDYWAIYSELTIGQYQQMTVFEYLEIEKQINIDGQLFMEI